MVLLLKVGTPELTDLRCKRLLPMDDHIPHTQDFLTFMAALDSPSLTRYIQTAQTMEVDPEAVDDPFFCQPSTSNPTSNSGGYQTRARTAQAPFSPQRMAVTRGGHMYHVDRPETVMSRDFEGPVVHIPDDNDAAPSPGGDSNASQTDIMWKNFLEEIKEISGDTSAKFVDDKKNDPTYHFRDEPEDKFPFSHVPQKEIRGLLEDLQENPIPGFQLTPAVVQNPHIVTRSATRSQSTDHDGISPSPSASPVKRPAERHVHTRSSGQTPEKLPTFTGVAQRTRSQLPASPLKPTGADFKKPFPIVEGQVKQQKTMSFSSHRSESSADPSGLSSLPHQQNPLPQEPISKEAMAEKFSRYRKKLSIILNDKELEDDTKTIVSQLFDGILNRSDKSGSGHGILVLTNPSKAIPEACVLMECVVQVLRLVRGQLSSYQFQPHFLEALRVDREWAYMIFGLMIYDESTLILELAPLLHGKTALLKSARRALMGAESAEIQNRLQKLVNKILTAEDGSKISDEDLRCAASYHLHVTGTEGLLSPADYEKVSISPEHVSDYDRKMKELEEAKAKREKQDQAGNRYGSISPPSVNQRVATLKCDSYAKAMQLEVISDSSNSSHYFPSTPGTPEVVHMDTTGPFPSSSHYSTALLASTFPSTLQGTPFESNEKRGPRRVPLLSSPLTFSPIKNAAFLSPSRNSKYQLRSSVRNSFG